MATRPSLLVLVVLVGACGSEPRPPGGAPCNGAVQACSGADLQHCVDGELVTVETCAGACDPAMGCVACTPGATVCLGQTSHACLGDGSGYVDDNCGDEAGELCDEGTGLCVKPCDPETLAGAYLGCEYYPTVTGNSVSNAYSFAIIIANYNGQAASATLDGGPSGPQQLEIPARGVVVVNLLWHPDLKLCNAPLWEDCLIPEWVSARADGGAFHLVTTLPVAVYQFNPLDYTLPGAAQFSYSNDASLLFPINVWGTEYRVASWRETNGAPGLMTVTAGSDHTTVTITPKASTQGNASVPSFMKDVAQTIVLDAGDVVELGTVVTGDLTGSLVTSDKPIQVIGGHYCANVPFGVAYCDHLEESMIPLHALGASYVVVAPRSDTFPDGRIEMVRVIATEPNTELTFDPPQPGVNTTLARAGDFLEIPTTAASFAIESTAKILVAQYMIGQTATTGTSDPDLTVAVPTSQYRTDYLFHAPTNYPATYADLIAPVGTIIVLDGVDVTAPATAIGSSGWALTRVTLDHGPAGDGNHRLAGTAPFGITVYGYGDYTSYWYPGGLDLRSIIR